MMMQSENEIEMISREEFEKLENRFKDIETRVNTQDKVLAVMGSRLDRLEQVEKDRNEQYASINRYLGSVDTELKLLSNSVKTNFEQLADGFDQVIEKLTDHITSEKNTTTGGAKE